MKNYNILVLVKSASESERIIHVFRQDNLPVRVHRVTSREDLNEHLDHDEWEIIIADNLHPEISLPHCLVLLKEKNLDTPLLLLSTDLSLEAKQQALKLGVTDIIDKTEENLFLHATKRELANSRSRREKHALQLAYDELSERADKLLSEAKESIAYIADGILIDCNQSFAQLLGFDDTEALECASFIDMVEDKDKEKLKQFFKLFDKNELVVDKHAFHLLRADNASVLVNITMKATFLNEEACIQINLMPENTHNQTGSASDNGSSDLYSVGQLVSKIDSLNLAGETQNYCFVLVAINDFIDLRKELLLSGSREIFQDLSGKVLALDKQLIPYQLTDDTLSFLYSGSVEDGLNFSNKLCESIEHHIFEYKNTSLPYTVSCCVIRMTSHGIEDFIDKAIQGLASIQTHDQNHAAIFKIEEATKKTNPLSATGTQELINHEAIELLYQPIMNLHGGEKENYEVTFRQCGGIDVLPLLTDSTLDRWLIIEATKTLNKHRANGHDTRLFINLSRFALKDEALPAWIKVVLKASDLPIDAIIFQFDDSDVRNNLKGAINLCQSLLSNNHLISFKNFTTSDKSLKILNHIQPQFINFEPEVTSGLANTDAFEMLKTILVKLSDIQVETILTNVTNAGELASLWQLGVSYITGSYLQEPDKKMGFEFTELH